MSERATRGATTPLAAPGGEPNRLRVGGRFWALADDSDCDEEEDGAAVPGSPEAPLPTPSDALCEALAIGYSEEVVAGMVDSVVPTGDPARGGLRVEETAEVLRRIVRRRTSLLAIRPWKGPIPKVRLPALTLQDFFRPDAWTVVSRHRNKKQPAVVRPPATTADPIVGIPDRRRQSLNSLFGQVGPEQRSVFLGLARPGYSA